MKWTERFKWLGALAAAVAALVALVFRRDRKPDAEKSRLYGLVKAEKEARAREARNHDVQEIERDVQDQLDDLDRGGDAGFMDRAFDHQRTGADGGGQPPGGD